MMFAPDTRVNPADEPEVQLLDDGDAISNRVKVVVKIDADDLGTRPTAPAAEPAPEAGTPSFMSLPLPAEAADPSTPTTPTTDTATVALPDGDGTAGTPQAPQVQVQAQLEVVDTPPAPETPAPAPDSPRPSSPRRAARHAGHVDGDVRRALARPAATTPAAPPRRTRRTARSHLVGCARCASSCPTRSPTSVLGTLPPEVELIRIGDGPIPAEASDARMALLAGHPSAPARRDPGRGAEPGGPADRQRGGRLARRPRARRRHALQRRRRARHPGGGVGGRGDPGDDPEVPGPRRPAARGHLGPWDQQLRGRRGPDSPLWPIPDLEGARVLVLGHGSIGRAVESASRRSARR